MSIEVKIPQVGESITEGQLAEWSKADGDLVALEDELLVLETDKVTLTVAAEAAGRLKILVAEGETVDVGQVVATIAAVEAGETATAPAVQDEASPPALSPAVQRLVDEHRIDAAAITGTGKGGRILKGDVLDFLASHDSAAATPEAATETPAAPEPRPADSTQAVPAAATAPQTREPMSRLRRRLAERLVSVQQEAAILTTFNEVDMSAVMQLRARYKETFKKQHDVGLGFMSFFVKATVEALKTVPQVNAFIERDEIVTNHYYDIGVAVSSDKGLVVPVVRNADSRSMAEIERSIVDLSQRARDRRLELSDLSGGVFTISNGGIFGSMLSTPILNPPQSAILGMHNIKKRAVVVDDEIVIRPMMYLAVSYDHRLVDGREAVSFLRRIVECIENPERLFLEV